MVPPKLKVRRSDAPTAMRRKVIDAAQDAVDALVEGREPVQRSRARMYVGIGPLRAKARRLARQLDPPRTWKELGCRWDTTALQALTVLVNSRLPALHCVAGNDFFTALKYAKGTLVFLTSPSFNLLLYKSVALSAAERISPSLAPSEPEEEQGGAAAVAVKVLESMADDEDTTRLAVRILSQGRAQTNEGESDTPAADRRRETREYMVQERADRLRHELDTVRGRWWHVVCDKQPLAASGPWPASTRLTLQRGKCTYICFRHADDPPTVLTAFANSPNAQKLIFVCVMGALYLTHGEVCPQPPVWLTGVCALVDNYGHYALAAAIMLYVYARMLSASKKVNSKRN